MRHRLAAAGGRASASSVSIRPEAIEIAPGQRQRGPTRGSGPRSSRWRTSARRFNITFARKGGLALTVLAGKSGQRFESGDSVVLGWAPSDALVLGDRSAEMEEHVMTAATTDRGMTFDEALADTPRAGRLEPARVPRAASPPFGRRDGADAAADRLPPARHREPVAAPATPARRRPADGRCGATATAAPDAGPHARERAVRLQLGRLHRRGHRREVRGEVRDQGHLRQLPRRDHPDRQAPERRQGRRLRRLLPGLDVDARVHRARPSSRSSTTR